MTPASMVLSWSRSSHSWETGCCISVHAQGSLGQAAAAFGAPLLPVPCGDPLVHREWFPCLAEHPRVPVFSASWTSQEVDGLAGQEGAVGVGDSREGHPPRAATRVTAQQSRCRQEAQTEGRPRSHRALLHSPAERHPGRSAASGRRATPRRQAFRSRREGGDSSARSCVCSLRVPGPAPMPQRWHVHRRLCHGQPLIHLLLPLGLHREALPSG